MFNTIVRGHSALLLVTILVLGCNTEATADRADPSPRIRVDGEGSVDLAPDMALLSLMVTREAKTARAAVDANNAAMSDVLQAMRAAGIADRDLQTSSFSIQPRYLYPRPKSSGVTEPPEIIGYTVRNGLTVRLRELARIGEILDTSVTLGVNEGGSITFSNDDPSAAITRARVEAMQDAMARAQTLAEAAGVKLGDIIEISEQMFNPRPAPMARAEMAMARSADAVPVAAGENTYRVTVNAVFAIESN
jgi:uncharacterized protein YggE